MNKKQLRRLGVHAYDKQQRPVIWGQRTVGPQTFTFDPSEVEPRIRRRLQATWTIETAEDLQTLYSADLIEQLTQQITEEGNNDDN